MTDDKISAHDFRLMIESGAVVPTKNRKRFKGVILNTEKEKKPDKRRVRGAVAHVYDDIHFDSTLEMEFYKFLQLHKVRFELKKVYELIPKFEYGEQKVRAMTWTPDFYFPDLGLIIDTKVIQTDTFELRLKLFKYKYRFQHPIIWQIKKLDHFHLAIQLIQGAYLNREILKEKAFMI